MKGPLLLSLLLGTVAALHLENNGPSLDSRETWADLSQNLECSGGQEGDPALTQESEGEETKPSGYQDTFADEEAMDSDPAALDKDLQCPKEEGTTCRFLLVRNLEKFVNAQKVLQGPPCLHIQLQPRLSHPVHGQRGRRRPGLDRRLAQGLANSCAGDFNRLMGAVGILDTGPQGSLRNGEGNCVALCTRGEGDWDQGKAGGKGCLWVSRVQNAASADVSARQISGHGLMPEATPGAV
ncbi:hypothetical protein GH733_007451 [Mirounga leonina]|nr:hypothetical protein GH733_007451 [Mirounga leonina]